MNWVTITNSQPCQIKGEKHVKDSKNTMLGDTNVWKQIREFQIFEGSFFLRLVL